MAGMSAEELFGGSGMPTLTTAPQAGAAVGNGARSSLASQAPQHGIVGLVLVAVLILFVLDKAGFRFAVTAGKR